MVAVAGLLAVVAAVVLPAMSLEAAIGAPSEPTLDRRRAARWREVVAACMSARGHDYRPFVEPPPPIPDADLGPVAWAERWGFGISTALAPSPPAPVDPNLRRIAGAPAAERTRYLGALFGTDGEPGCHATATEAVHGLRQRALASLETSLAALATVIDADPIVMTAGDAWLTCVRRVLPDGVSATAVRSPGDTDALRRWFAARVGIDGGSEPGPPSIQAEERRVAASVARCDVALAAARAIGAGPHEAAFVRDHRLALARIGAAIRRAEAAYPPAEP